MKEQFSKQAIIGVMTSLSLGSLYLLFELFYIWSQR
jgi:hypothetical protein